MTALSSSTDDAGRSRVPDGLPSHVDDFRHFADRLAAGESDAASELLARFSARLVALARRKLGSRLSVKADPEDVLQSVLRTFYRRLSEGEVELRDWAALSGFLTLLTIRKCQRQAERHLSGKRDIRREAAVDPAFQIPDREPTPAEAAVFADLLESLLNALDDQDRQVIERFIAGDPANKIAEQIGCSRRTVYRTVERIRDRLERSVPRTTD
jgi:RNA polymerase sigma factor (sigma-70 family)